MQWWNRLRKHPKFHVYFSVLLLLTLCTVAFLWNLGSTGLVDETEPLFAEAARQMVVTGDWITPYFNGETRFDKPPLVYWLMAVGYQIFGTNEWAVRLPSALGAIALTLGCFWTLLYFGGSPSPEKEPKPRFWLTAWIGSALVTLNPQTLIWARTGVSDMLLSGCMGCALLCFFWGYASSVEGTGNREQGIAPRPRAADKAQGNARQDGNREKKKPGNIKLLPNKGYFAFYILTAFAVLAKGPVGIVIPGLTIFIFLLCVGRFWQVVREMGIFVGGAVFLVLTVPWYVLVILRNGQTYIDSFFGYHNFERFTGVVNGHGAPWFFYFGVVLVGCLPWSVYLPLAIARSMRFYKIVRLRFWKRSRLRKQPRSEQLGLFALCWFFSIFGFFTIAVTKLPSYTLPLIPAAAILVALYWSQIFTAIPKRPQRLIARQGAAVRPRAAERRATPRRRQGARERASSKRPAQAFEETSNDADLGTRTKTEGRGQKGQTDADREWDIHQDSGKKVAKEWGFLATGIFNALLLLVLAIVAFYSPNLIGYDPAAPNLGELFRQTGLHLRGGIIWGMVSGAIALLLLQPQIRRWILLANLLGFFAFIIFALMPASEFIDRERQLPLRELAATITQVQQPGEEIFMTGFKKPSLVFYTQRPVNFIGDKNSAIARLQQEPTNAPTLLLLAQPTTFANTFDLQPNQYENLGQRGAYQLIRLDKQILLNSPEQ
ncbi:glycosyltransferase family 39 protein [Lusitaniella coriacea LEGE 07157]|uniref:Glycosyltransferase family 39 protein n=1 Tax=Lusitaniella coriacea LEGE 07157 TaxID=945747 RepID=A0A8J7E0H8_9CYAN|nr:glycosyltransferase family 39 protein [Lusitaniella coriacea]MBE9117993.1 glycosyltransferase family 39 protein [Lusitaniella coriacea LEGE 07157]